MLSDFWFCLRVVMFLNLLKKLHHKVSGIFSEIDGKLCGPNKFRKSCAAEQESEKQRNRKRVKKENKYRRADFFYYVYNVHNVVGAAVSGRKIVAAGK